MLTGKLFWAATQLGCYELVSCELLSFLTVARIKRDIPRSIPRWPQLLYWRT